MADKVVNLSEYVAPEPKSYADLVKLFEKDDRCSYEVVELEDGLIKLSITMPPEMLLSMAEVLKTLYEEKGEK